MRAITPFKVIQGYQCRKPICYYQPLLSGGKHKILYFSMWWKLLEPCIFGGWVVHVQQLRLWLDAPLF